MGLSGLIFSRDFDAVKEWVFSHPGCVNEVDSAGLSPLGVAIEAYDPNIVYFLLENGANPNDWGGGNCPPLHLAIDNAAEAFRNSPLGAPPPSLQIIQLLLDFGADINELDFQGENAVTFAKGWYKPAYELLLRQASQP